MQNTSTAFRNELNKDNRRYIESCTITLADGTALHIDNSDIWSNGFKVEEAVSSDNNFDIGAVIVGKFTLILNNIYDDFSDYDFNGAVISNVRVGLELPNGTIETVKKGIYTVDEPRYNGSIITLECLDNMAKFDQPYALSKITYPATLGAIVRDACNCCGVQLAADSAAFEMSDYVVDTRPDDKSTFREILSYVGEISCHWCRCNVNGQLSLGWYDMSVLENADDLDGGKFDGGKPYSTGDNADGGNFKDYNSGDDYDGGDFKSLSKFHQIHSLSSMDVSTDDVVITGIRVIETAPEDSEEDDITYQAGEDGYVLTVEGNKLIQGGKGAQVASYLGSRLIGMQFRPFSVSCLSDPAMEAGDCAWLVDRKGNRYRTVITNITFQAGNYQRVSCGAQSPARNSATRYSKATQAYRTLRRQVNRNKTEWEKAMEDLGNRLENSSGLYSTIETQQDGSGIYYLHDKPTLKESAIVWKMTAEAWGVSTDGGETWNGGMTVDGEVIARILHTIGINADWINTGAMVVKDAAGNILFRADVDTGRVDIVADSFSLKGKTISQMAQDELNDFVNSVYGPDIDSLQAQIDGQIETYYFDYEPSLTNTPASAWTSNEERNKHIGDLFYWKSKGYAYRFLQDGATWKWQLVQDTDITQALAAAENAQDTADGKRRVFVVTPQPPYDIGDLWAQGSTGDLMRCRVSRSSGTYTSSDWEKASKYTDDAALNNFISGTFADSIKDLQAQADKKAETWYQASDPSTGWSTAQKAEHKGDLWYNISNQRTYIYNGTAWEETKTAPPDEVFDRIDGKAQIFIAQPIPPYAAGDLWVTSTENGKAAVKICKTARSSGAYTASDWIDTKYIDKSQVDNAINAYDTSLGQNEVFNKLTNGGKNQGLFVQNGNLYINADYILAGLLAGEFINAKGIKVLDKSGNTTFYIDDNGNVTLRVTSFSLEGNSIQNIANSAAGSAANSALSSAKSYTDTKLANIKPNMTQQEIYDILTNNGRTQGIYLSGGGIYINATYINTGVLAGWTVDAANRKIHCTVGFNKAILDAGNGLIQTEDENAVFGGEGYARMKGNTIYADIAEFYSASTRADMTVGGTLNTNMQNAGTIKLNGRIENSAALLVEPCHIKVYAYGVVSTALFDVNAAAGDSVMRSLDMTMQGLPVISSGNNLALDSSSKVKKVSSSSKRYKDFVRNMSLEDVEKLYELPVLFFKYKDGYLEKGDILVREDIPGFFAEDVQAYYPKAVKYIKEKDIDSQWRTSETDKLVPEDWEPRFLLPGMLKLIQEQKKQIDILETTTQEQSDMIASLEERISKLEQLIGGECLVN